MPKRTKENLLDESEEDAELLVEESEEEDEVENPGNDKKENIFQIIDDKVDEDISNEINKANDAEKEYVNPQTKYKELKKTSIEMDNSYEDKYALYLENGELELTSAFIEGMKLENGKSNVQCKISDFNKGFLKALENSFHTSVAEYKTDKKLIKSTEKTRYSLPFDLTDRNSIIDYAKAYRGQCFAYLTGNGKPSASNPKFVVNDGKKLVYNFNEINKLVKEFKSDKDLYKDVISCIDYRHYRRECRKMEFSYTMEGDAMKVKFGSGTNEMQYDTANKYLRTYLTLKEVHANRPWYYMFAHPFMFTGERYALADMEDTLSDTAKKIGIQEEIDAIIDAKSTDKNLKDKFISLREKMEMVFGPQLVGEEHAPENENMIQKIGVNLEDGRIIDRSVKERNLVAGEGMSEKEKFVSDDEYNKIYENNNFSEITEK